MVEEKELLPTTSDGAMWFTPLTGCRHQTLFGLRFVNVKMEKGDELDGLEAAQRGRPPPPSQKPNPPPVDDKYLDEDDEEGEAE